MKRPSANERGYDTRWRKLRAMKLTNDPLCEWCLGLCEHCLIKPGDEPLCKSCWENMVYTKATLVHHIKEVEFYPELRLDIMNLLSGCHSCHEQHHKRDKNRGCDKDGAPVDPNHHWNV